MKRFAAILLLLLLAAGGGWLSWRILSSQGAAQQEGTLSPEDAMYSEDAEERPVVSASGTVDTTMAAIVSSQNTYEGIVRLPAIIQRQQTKKVTSNSSRKVAEVLVKEGDKVSNGTVLMRYDDENDEMTIQSKEYEIEKQKLRIESAKMSVTKAEQELPKLKGLDLEERQIEIRKTLNQIALAEYTIETNEKQIEQLKEMIKEKEVKSSYVGTVTKITKGSENSTDSDTDSSDGKVTITIAESQNLILMGQAKDSDMGSFRQGDSVIVYSRVDPTVHWTGYISRVRKPGEKDSSGSGSDSETQDEYSGYDSGSSGKNTWYGALDSEEGLLVGQHVFVEPDYGQTSRTEGLWLSEEYILTENDQTYVWVEGENGRITKRAVSAAEPDNYGIVQILDGLDRLEYIAVNSSYIREGMRTRHAEDTLAANTGNTAQPSDGDDLGILGDGESYDDYSQDMFGDDEIDFGDFEDFDEDFGDDITFDDSGFDDGYDESYDYDEGDEFEDTYDDEEEF